MGANFCGKSEKAIRINFHGFKFRDSKAWYCTNDDVNVLDLTHDFPCHKATSAETCIG